MADGPAATVRLVDAESGMPVAELVSLATSFWERFRGLMLRPSLAGGEGLFLATSSIHMFFMRFAIDALFVSHADPEGVRTVVAAHRMLRPWRSVVLPVRGAEGVVELPAGTLQAAAVGPGARVRLEAPVRSA